MRHVQHPSLESLVKMDHFQKEPPLNLKGPLGHKGVERGQYPKEQIGNPAQTECPLGSKADTSQRNRHVRFTPESRHVRCNRGCRFWAISGLMHRSKQHLYSITSSARVSMVGGTAKPIAFAVLRLMTSSKRVGCSTGRSAGLAPLNILST
jgi:hypothetical protein